MRIAPIVFVVLSACGHREVDPRDVTYRSQLVVDGGVPGTLVRLGDHDLGFLVRSYDGRDVLVRGEIRGLSVAEGEALFAKPGAVTLAYDTPCGPVSIQLTFDPATVRRYGRRATVPAGTKLPEPTLVYTDGDITKVRLGVAAIGARTADGLVRTNVEARPRTPAPGEHAAWVFGARCAPSIKVEVDGHARGELDTAAIDRGSARLARSLFVPSAATGCYTFRVIGYGVDGDGQPHPLAGAPAYVLPADRVDFLLQPADSSIQVSKGETGGYRSELVATKCP